MVQQRGKWQVTDLVLSFLENPKAYGYLTQIILTEEEKLQRARGIKLPKLKAAAKQMSKRAKKAAMLKERVQVIAWLLINCQIPLLW